MRSNGNNWIQQLPAPDSLDSVRGFLNALSSWNSNNNPQRPLMNSKKILTTMILVVATCELIADSLTPSIENIPTDHNPVGDKLPLPHVATINIVQ